MKANIILLAATLAFAVGCTQPTPNNPSTANGGKLPLTPGQSVVDIATPSFTGSSQSAGTSSGHNVHLTWASNSPNSAWSYAQDPTTPTDLNAGHGWEYWGSTQLTIVTDPHYSGHYELWRVNPDGTTTDLPDVTADEYVDENVADGTYTYYLKAKSQEKDDPTNPHSSTHEHHSDASQGYTVVVTSCIETNVKSIVGSTTAGDNVTWVDASHITANKDAKTWNFHCNLINTYTNSCTGSVVTTIADGTPVYYSFNGGAWTQMTWQSAGLVYFFHATNPSQHTDAHYTLDLSLSSTGSPSIGTYDVHGN